MARIVGRDVSDSPPRTPSRTKLVDRDKVAEALASLPPPGALDEAIVMTVAEWYADGRLVLAAITEADPASQPFTNESQTDITEADPRAETPCRCHPENFGGNHALYCSAYRATPATTEEPG